MAAEDDSVLRIVISTDNHLGYKERDPVRGADSFAAFEEVLSFAKWKGVDMLLLGGDVFHDNKPSRRTMHNTYDLLREYVLGPEPVAFQILSDQGDAFEGRRGQVNYEDPSYSVSLPVFAIHGNHDDPTREGGTDALAALDLLSITNFVNYFGKANKVDDVTIKPILMRKGTTKLALYGLGNIRDERLNRMWTKKKVKFLRPSEAEGRDDYFNILVLHQNRAEGRGRKNAIFESMIPEWFDVVIWGHEHECQPQFSESLHGRFRVLQPGSTVATSLVDGEAQPKHLAILELKEQQFRLQTYRLKNVRPFVTDEIRLDDEEYGLDPEDVKVEQSIDRVLEETVKILIARARRERREAIADEAQGLPPNRLYKMQEPNQVLCRLKVDRLGFQTLNNQRFGARFVGEVANPSDIVLWCQRRRAAEGAASAATTSSSSSRASRTLAMPIAPADGDELNVEDLVTDQLASSDKKLKLLKESELKDALEEYVQKMEANAINELVQNTLDDTQKKLNGPDYRGVTTAALIQEAVEDYNQPSQTQPSQTQPSQTQLSQTQSQAASGSLSRRSSSARPSMSDDEGDDDPIEVADNGEVVVELTPPPKRSAGRTSKAQSKKAAAAKKASAAIKRPRKRAAAKDDYSEEDEFDEDEFDKEDEEEEVSEELDSEEEVAPKKRTKRASAPVTAAAKKKPAAAAKKKQAETSRSPAPETKSKRALPGWASASQSVASDYSDRSLRHAADDWS